VIGEVILTQDRVEAGEVADVPPTLPEAVPYGGE
jgi:hypothetical protein